jgi:hypothetical protein
VVGECGIFPITVRHCHVLGWFWFSNVPYVVHVVAIVSKYCFVDVFFSFLFFSESIYVFTLLFKYLIAAEVKKGGDILPLPKSLHVIVLK